MFALDIAEDHSNRGAKVHEEVTALKDCHRGRKYVPWAKTLIMAET